MLVSYHELYGFSLQITDIDPSYTLGDMERQRQQTIAQLQQDGVWEMNREVPMPAVVQRIAIVSSVNAAGYQDFCKELDKAPTGSASRCSTPSCRAKRPRNPSSKPCAPWPTVRRISTPWC